MISDLSAQGIHTVLITDLHIKKDPNHGYTPYDSGLKDDIFLKRADGSTYVGPVWPGDSVFGDLRSAKTKKPDRSSRIFRAYLAKPDQRHWWSGNTTTRTLLFHRSSKN
jgi:hypothetical protein